MVLHDFYSISKDKIPPTSSASVNKYSLIMKLASYAFGLRPDSSREQQT